MGGELRSARASPVASTAVPAAPPPTGDANPRERREPRQLARRRGPGPGADALREAFARLAPRGAMPGTSWPPSRISAIGTARTIPAPPRCRTRWRPRAAAAAGGAGPPRPPAAAPGPRGAGRRGREDRPRGGDGPRGRGVPLPLGPGRHARGEAGRPGPAGGGRGVAGPARELGDWVGPVAAHVLARTPGGVIVHADCGEGGLLARAAGARRGGARGRAPGCGRPPCHRARLLGDHRRGVRVPGGARADGLAGRHRAERGGRSPAAPCAAPAAGAEPAGPARAARRSSSSPSPSRPWAPRERRPSTWWTGDPSTRRPGRCCCERAGFVEVAPLPAGAGRTGGSPWWPSPPRERHPPLRPRPAPWRRGGAPHPPPAGRHPRPRLPLRDLRRHRRRRRRRAETVPVLDYPGPAEPGDVVVYQFATASAMAPWLAGRSETLVVNYHNITPPDLMAPWDNHLALGQLRAQGDLRVLAPRTTLAVADSAYNEAHLAAVGVRRHGRDPTVGRPRRRRHSGGTRQPATGAAARRERRTLAGGREGVAQQGAGEHRRRPGRGPGPRRPGRHAADHREAGHGVVRVLAAALRGGAGAGRRGHLRRPCRATRPSRPRTAARTCSW